MAELPEVETLRRQLDKDVVGRKVKAVDVDEMSAVSHHPNKKTFADKLEGIKVASVTRRAMLLLLGMENDETLVISLGPTGRLVRAATKVATPDDQVVALTFTQGGQLRFLDPSGKGAMWVVPTDEGIDDMPELEGLGKDPIEEPISWTAFGQQLMKRKMKLKPLLLDDSFLIGIGPIYADEILFSAGLRFDRVSDSLSTQEVRRLYRATVSTIHDAVKYRGTTTKDGLWVDLHDDRGEYQDHLQVFERDGQLSPRSRLPILKKTAGGRTTYYCDTQS